ncbi:MAG: FecCD family ABC transporter permease [Anaerovoracaceae bacterium]|jgi:iron complex transport system permease protein
MRTGLRHNASAGTGASAAVLPDTIYTEELKKKRKKYIQAAIILLLLLLAFLCFRSTKIAFMTPWQTLTNTAVFIKLQFGKLFNLSYYADRYSIITSHKYYLETVTRLQGGLSAICMGAAMSVAGAVFQSVFRNPIAVPTMLGVSSGINIANFILVMQYGVLATTMTLERFEWGYIASLAILFIVLGFSRLTSRGNGFSVADVLLIGTVLTRIITQILNAIQSTFMDDAAYQTLQEMNMYGAGIGNARGWIFLAASMIFGLVPILLMRNSLNIVTFSDDESRVMGLNADAMRVLALIFSTILIIAAQIYLGDVGMLALLVPHICRTIYGSNTRDLILGSIIVGGIMMLVCRFVVSLMMFNQYLSVISVGMIINVISIPLMFYILFSEKKGWE